MIFCLKYPNFIFVRMADGNFDPFESTTTEGISTIAIMMESELRVIVIILFLRKYYCLIFGTIEA